MRLVLKKMYNEKLKNIIISIFLIALCSVFFYVLFDNETLNVDLSTYLIGNALRFISIVILIMLVAIAVKNFHDLFCIFNYSNVISGISDNDQLYDYSVSMKVTHSKYFERKDYKIGNIEISGIGINEVTRNLLSKCSYKNVTVYINDSNVYIVK